MLTCTMQCCYSLWTLYGRLSMSMMRVSLYGPNGLDGWDGMIVAMIEYPHSKLVQLPPSPSTLNTGWLFASPSSFTLLVKAQAQSDRAHAHTCAHKDAARKPLPLWLPFLSSVSAAAGAPVELELLGPSVAVAPLLAGPTCTISYPSASGRNSCLSRPMRTPSSPRYLRNSSR